MPHAMFRPRRLREKGLLRRLVRETALSVNDLVYPMFAVHGRGVREPIGSMPGQFRLSIDELMREAKDVAGQAVQTNVVLVSVVVPLCDAMSKVKGFEEVKPPKVQGAPEPQGTAASTEEAAKSATAASIIYFSRYRFTLLLQWLGAPRSSCCRQATASGKAPEQLLLSLRPSWRAAYNYLQRSGNP